MKIHSSNHCSLLPLADRLSRPDSHRSAQSASSRVPSCSASSSSSSAKQWQWPCGSSVWLRTPALAADSSCAEPLCCGIVSSHSPCGRADASAHRDGCGCPGLCVEVGPCSPDLDTGWAQTDSTDCGWTALRGGRCLCNHRSHSYTVKHRNQIEYMTVWLQ